MTNSFTIYDFKNRGSTVGLPDKEVLSIVVNILSGDETGIVLFKDGSSLGFDASNQRIADYRDGTYAVTGDKEIDWWVNWTPPNNSITIAYDREEAFHEWKEGEASRVEHK